MDNLTATNMTISRKLNSEEITNSLNNLGNSWAINTQAHLYKEYKTKDFKHAMSLANIISSIAEGKNQHPDLSISYTMLKVEIWSHDARGLTHDDFELASAIEGYIFI
jgi:pterin-4a-carbinolamine dehydratase